MVKVPKYICDASNDVPWLPKRFWDGSVIAQAYCIRDWYDGCGADAGMWWKGYGNRRVLIFWRGELGEMGRTGSHGCGEHWRTLENAQEEILCNSISPLGPNPEVCAENFLYIRWRKTVVGLQQIFFPICCPHPNKATFVSKEWRYSGSSTWSVVIGEFHKWKQCIPIVLLIVAENL